MAVWERRNYTNKDIDCLYSTYIREYDISSAGMNVLYREGALSDNEYRFLSGLKKSDRHVRVGYILRDNKELNETLGNGLKRVMKEFMEANNLTDSDILSIKNDAIFVINKRCKVLEFDNVKFNNKNTYTSYYHLNQHEFYFKKGHPESILDIKGISDKMYHKHEPMLNFLKDLFKTVESSDNKRVFTKLTTFALAYMNKELDIGYYRELSNTSLYRSKMKYRGQDIGYDLFNGDVDDIIISFNYKAYILPLMGILL